MASKSGASKSNRQNVHVAISQDNDVETNKFLLNYDSDDSSTDGCENIRIANGTSARDNLYSGKLEMEMEYMEEINLFNTSVAAAPSPPTVNPPPPIPTKIKRRPRSFGKRIKRNTSFSTWNPPTYNPCSSDFSLYCIQYMTRRKTFWLCIITMGIFSTFEISIFKHKFLSGSSKVRKWGINTNDVEDKRFESNKGTLAKSSHQSMLINHVISQDSGAVTGNVDNIRTDEVTQDKNDRYADTTNAPSVAKDVEITPQATNNDDNINAVNNSQTAKVKIKKQEIENKDLLSTSIENKQTYTKDGNYMNNETKLQAGQNANLEEDLDARKKQSDVENKDKITEGKEKGHNGVKKTSLGTKVESQIGQIMSSIPIEKNNLDIQIVDEKGSNNKSVPLLILSPLTNHSSLLKPNKSLEGEEEISIFPEYNSQHSSSSWVSICGSSSKRDDTQKPNPKTESAVFKNILGRSKESKIDACQDHSSSSNRRVLKYESHLAEFGIVPFIEESLCTNKSQKSVTGKSREQEPQCELPPPVSCSTMFYTVVIEASELSHLQSTHEKIEQYRRECQTINRNEETKQHPFASEIIVVWNGDNDMSKDKWGEKIILSLEEKGDGDNNSNPSSFVVRLFHAKENGLSPYHPMNRYHPDLEPMNDAVMYAGDSHTSTGRAQYSVEAGFQLWRRNSNTQVGMNLLKLSLPIPLREIQRNMTSIAVTQIKDGKYGEPYDLYSKDQPHHIPISYLSLCSAHRFLSSSRSSSESQAIQLNIEKNPTFNAQIIEAPGSFIHRNLLCFLWHPAFEEVRTYVQTATQRDHNTRIDDIAVSLILSQVTGKAPRMYPRAIKTKRTTQRIAHGRKLSALELPEAYNSSKEVLQQDHILTKRPTMFTSEEEHYVHSRSLSSAMNSIANSKTLRTNAINDIANYFGSISPGTVGWCVGTSYHQTHAIYGDYCNPKFGVLGGEPWMNNNGLENDVCLM